MSIQLSNKKYQWLIGLLLLMVLLSSYSTGENGETDTDTDGLPDTWEEQYFENITKYGAEDDPDNDGLSNLEEYQNGTSPVDTDTDKDEMPDSWEQTYGLDATNPSDAAMDYDNDGFTNLEEYQYMTDPTDPDDDGPKKSKEEGDGDDNSLLILPLFVGAGFVFLITIMFVYTKMRREQLLQHKVRSDIYNYVTKNPGIHYRGIMNELNLQMGVLTHHLNMLEQEQYIKSLQDGMYRRFYPKNAPVNTGLVLTDVQKQILQLIRSTPGISQSAVARQLGYTKKVVYYHVKILANAGFIHVETAGRESQCFYIEGLDDAGIQPEQTGIPPERPQPQTQTKPSVGSGPHAG
jgi:DNA-binding MarR family transcriptional regulator